jgi:hypothetical protein
MGISRSGCCSGMFSIVLVHGGELGMVCYSLRSLSVFRGLAAVRHGPVRQGVALSWLACLWAVGIAE